MDGHSLQPPGPRRQTPPPWKAPLPGPAVLRSATTPLFPVNKRLLTPSDLQQEIGILTTWSQVQGH